MFEEVGGKKMKEHELKTWPKEFQDIWVGRKKFDLRKNDREFSVGDVLFLREWDPETKTHTGRILYVKVIYILSNFLGLQKDYVIMGIEIEGANYV
jgi:hypothetical protein